MTTLACLSPKITLLVTSALPLLYLTSYPTLAKKHKDMRTTAASHKNVQYSPLNSQKTELLLSCKEKIEVVWKTAPLLIFFVQSYALEYLIMQAIVTTIAFLNAPFDPRNHYVYYMLCFTAGEFVGRSYVSIAGVISPERDFQSCQKDLDLYNYSRFHCGVFTVSVVVQISYKHLGCSTLYCS